ncbi:ribonuclease HI family protein [Methyloversatilis universalis]|uniref:ribonuclease HI family protein n=1 Tax=Methyloversatilis universalis TaxID=378211 RepID=UPI000361965A|nr:ribonuclease HI family protein [Methyloversatilis universalis]
MAPSRFARARLTVSLPPESDDSDCWLLWFDGCAWPNPGRLGLGALIVAPDGRRIELSQAGSRHGCNNEAELEALRIALERARAEGARRLQVIGDSDVVLRHLGGDRRATVEPLCSQLQAVAATLAGFDRIELRWVPRHRNRDADRLSRAALGLPDKPAPVPGRGRPRRRRVADPV